MHMLQRVYEVKSQWGNRCKAHSFLNSALNGVEWSVSLHGRFTPFERT